MSRPNPIRWLALTGTVLAAALSAAAPAAATPGQPVTYGCAYPLIGSQPLSATFAVVPPTNTIPEQPTGQLPLTVAIPGGLLPPSAAGSFGAASIEGSATVELNAGTASTGSQTVTVQLPIAKHTPGDALTLTGSIPSLSFAAGFATYRAETITLNLLARGADGTPRSVGQPGIPDSDGNPDTFDVGCGLAPPTQDPVIASIRIGSSFCLPMVFEVTQVTSEFLSPTSARISWRAPTTGGLCGEFYIVGYTIFVDGVEVAQTTGSGATSFVLEDLEPGTTHTLKIAARGPSGQLTTQRQEYTFTLPASPITDHDYAVAGSATLASLAKGSVPLKGSLAATIDATTGAVTGDLALAPSTANLVALGFLPVKAKLVVVAAAPVSGSLVDGALSLTAKVRIKLPSVTLLGLELAGGTTCQTKQPSGINLRTTGAAFDPIAGGLLAGTFAISNLTGCGSLTGLVSQLTAGSGNAMALSLTPAV